MRSISFLTTALLLLAASLSAKVHIDPDLFWHLKVGELALSGTLPVSEPWSWIAVGQPFYPHSWLYDALLAVLFGLGGHVYIGLLGILTGGAAVFLAYRVARLWHPGVPPVALAGSVVIGFLLAAPALSARAQVLDLLFSLCVIWLLERHRLGRLSPRGLIVLPLIALLWANLHGAGILAGAVVGGVLLVERAMAGERRTLLPTIAAGVTAALAACLSPLGPRLLVYPIATLVSPVQQALINEWQPISVDTPGGTLLIGLLLILAMFGGRRSIRFGPLLLAAGWTWMALGSIRYVLIAGPLLAIAVLPVVFVTVAPRLERVFMRLTGRAMGDARLTLATALGALLIAASLVMVRLTPGIYEARLDARYPVGAVDFLIEQGCRGRIANAYGWGGYLLWRWGEPVGHYGAADAFGDELLRPYLESLNRLSVDPGMWLDENQVELALFSGDEPISRWLDAAGWDALYRDQTAVLYAAPGSRPCR